MKVTDKTLIKALEFSYKKQYNRLITFLEPKISQYMYSTTFFYLLGRSYLLTSDLENAELYIERGLKINDLDYDLQMMLALIKLRRREITKTLHIWLEISKTKPKDKKVNTGLNLIRKMDDEELLQFANGGRAHSLLPNLAGHGSYLAWRFISRTLLVFSLLALLGATYYFFSPSITEYFKEDKKDRLSLEGFSLDKQQDFLMYNDRVYRYTITTKELQEYISTIKKNYNLMNDNLVQMHINRIIYSNANNEIKVKLQDIESTLVPPAIFNLQSNFAYADVVIDPFLYEKTFVIWVGKATNIVFDKDKTSFDFLVGYTDGNFLEGQVPVLFDSLLTLNSFQNIRVLAQIIRNNETSFYLLGKTIQPIPKEAAQEPSASS